MEQSSSQAQTNLFSEMNITITAALFIALFGRWLGARRGAIAAGLAIAHYTILISINNALLRAAIMSRLGLLIHHPGRQTHDLTPLDPHT